MVPVRDSYVCKDDFKDYGPYSTNLFKDYFYIYINRNNGTKERKTIL